MGELSRLGRLGNKPGKRDNFFSYKHFGSSNGSRRGAGAGSGGSIEPPKLKQLTSKNF